MVAFWGRIFFPWICLRFLVSVPCFPPWFGLSTNPMYFFSQMIFCIDLTCLRITGEADALSLNWTGETAQSGICLVSRGAGWNLEGEYYAQFFDFIVRCFSYLFNSFCPAVWWWQGELWPETWFLCVLEYQYIFRKKREKNISQSF